MVSIDADFLSNKMVLDAPSVVAFMKLQLYFESKESSLISMKYDAADLEKGLCTQNLAAVNARRRAANFDARKL